MCEIYKDIPGFSLYQINRSGNIKNKVTGHNIKPRINKDGYYRVILYKNHKIKTMLVHRLVALTFIDNPNKLPYINHKNEVKTDNRVNNLEWCDAKYNSNYGTAISRRKIKLYKKVMQKNKKGETIKLWDRIKEAGESLNINVHNISYCCSGKIPSAGGFVWNYEVINNV